MSNENNNYIKVKTFPSAKKEKVVKKGEESFEIYVKEPAKNNMATNKTRSILANRFNVPISRIKLIKGARTQNKIFELQK